MHRGHRCVVRTLICHLISVHALACSVDPSFVESRPPLTVEGQALLDSLEGTWSLQVTVSGDCPSEWRRALPSGQVIFRADGGGLSITRVGASAPDFTLYPMDGDTLTYSTTASVAGCSAQESAEFILESLADSTAQGTLYVDLSRDDTPACEAFLDDTGVPSSCRTTTEFMGIRLSSALGN